MHKMLSDLLKKYRVTDGTRFRLKDYNPADTGPLKIKQKQESRELLLKGVEQLSALQEKLYAQDRWGVLLIFQAMDAAGKDSTVKHVMSGVNPQGCQVHSFKAPTSTELDHDYLWRCVRALPERGQIGIFNRSYYEEVLVVRIHPEYLEHQKLPSALITKKIWKERYEDIRAFEKYLSRNGFLIRKFFLNVSKNEQQKRFLERLDKPEKNWKFSAADLEERNFWNGYQKAYEEMLGATSTEEAPWYVVPADNKWYTRLVVAAVVVDALKSLHLEFPRLSPEQQQKLVEIRERIRKE